jgi:hypothetical protein
MNPTIEDAAECLLNAKIIPDASALASEYEVTCMRAEEAINTAYHRIGSRMKQPPKPVKKGVPKIWKR